MHGFNMSPCLPLPYKRVFVGMYLVLVISTSFHETHSHNATVEDFTRLLKDKIFAFDNRIRPLTNQGEALDVYITVNFLNLIEIDEKQQQVQLNAWLNFSWYDEIRVWNASNYGGISVIQPLPLDTWIPRVIVSNSLGKRDLFGDDYVPMAIFSDGASRWFPGSVFSLSCDLDLTYFPFDTQSCSMTLIGREYRNSVRLQFSKAGLRAGGYTKNGEWKFVSHEVSNHTLTIGREVINDLTIFLVFERRPEFYVINILVPVMFMSFLSFFGFIIPHDSGERISFAVTVLLSLAVYMTIVSSEIPASSDTFPIIVHFIFSLLLLSGSAVITVVVLHRIQGDTSDVAALADQQHPQATCNCKVSTKMNTRAPPLEPCCHEGIIGVDSNNAGGDDQVTISVGNNLRVLTQPTDRNSNTYSEAVNLNKFQRKFSKAKPYVVKKIFAFLRQVDIQLFLVFALVWLSLSIYFLNKLLSNS